MITSLDVQYGQVDGALTTTRIGNSDITSYIVIGLLPFTEYRFQIAGVNSDGPGVDSDGPGVDSDGPGPYTAFIGPIRTNVDGGLKFNLAMMLCIIYNSLTKILRSTGSCIRFYRVCQVLHHGAILESTLNA